MRATATSHDMLFSKSGTSILIPNAILLHNLLNPDAPFIGNHPHQPLAYILDLIVLMQQLDVFRDCGLSIWISSIKAFVRHNVKKEVTTKTQVGKQEIRRLTLVSPLLPLAWLWFPRAGIGAVLF